MKKQFLFLLLLIGLFLTLASCDWERVDASGNVTIESYSFTNFSGLDVGSDFKVYVAFSDTEERVEIEADDNLHEYIEVKLEGNTLVIRVENDVSIRGNETLNAYITTSSIESLEASGDSEIFLEDVLSTKRVRAELSGDSRLEGEIVALDIDVELRGDSKMSLTGSAKRMEATIKGDSYLEDFGFVVDELEIDLSGDSEAYLTVLETIDIEATGDSRLVYKGDAVVTRQRLTGDSELIKVD